MKVIIADLFSEASIQELKEGGFDIHYEHGLNGESLKKAMEALNPEILVVRSTKVTADIVDAASKLQLVVRAGAGYDTIDVTHCSKKGIYVANCPGKNAVAVAELAFALIISLERRIADNVAELRQGKWNKGEYMKATGLKGKTLGLIGFGNIGKELAKRARAFEMTVIVHSRHQISETEAKLHDVIPAKNLDDLITNSDIVSLHIPRTNETKGLVNKEFLSKMKKDAFLINTARGDVVDEKAILERLEETKDFYYATDVYQGEPAGKDGPFDHILGKHPRVYGTHHIGASTKQAEGAIGDEATRILKKFGATRSVDTANCVNLATDIKKNHVVAIRHLDKVGVFAKIFQLFAQAGWNVQETNNLVFANREACVVQIRFIGELNKKDSVTEELKNVPEILDVAWVAGEGQ